MAAKGRETQATERGSNPMRRKRIVRFVALALLPVLTLFTFSTSVTVADRSVTSQV